MGRDGGGEGLAEGGRLSYYTLRCKQKHKRTSTRREAPHAAHPAPTAAKPNARLTVVVVEGTVEDCSSSRPIPSRRRPVPVA